MSLVAHWANEELAALAKLGLSRQLEPIESPQGAVIRVGDRELINFSSNDYLGLAADPRIREAAITALRQWGTGAGASRLLLGDSLMHRALETELADFEHAEAALLFNSGYAANVGILSTLGSEEDALFSDALNHASIIDGCRMSKARVVVYPHCDVAALETLLERTPARRKIVVTDSVFSMDGDVAPLRELVATCQRQQAALVVDEAHATGVLGATGAGACEQFSIENVVDVRMGTLGKALGVFGAYVLSQRPVVDWLINRARSLVFSTAMPPAICAAAAEAVRVVRSEPQRRERLWTNIRLFADGLRTLGFAAEARSAIFPLVLGSAESAVAASRALRERGIVAKAIRPPTVPTGTSRLRFAISAAHSAEHIDRALEAIRALELRHAA